jgi:predicted  nucleic acid-binding Zn-ribbon protein
MVWACPGCGAPVPDDSEELALARFCRECGSAYFGIEEPAEA